MKFEEKQATEGKYPVTLTFRCSLNERDYIRNCAKVSGHSISKYLRKMALKKHIQAKADKEAVALLFKLGGLFKSLHTQGQKIPWELVEKCNNIIERITNINT